MHILILHTNLNCAYKSQLCIQISIVHTHLNCAYKSQLCIHTFKVCIQILSPENKVLYWSEGPYKAYQNSYDGYSSDEGAWAWSWDVDGPAI